MRPLSDGGAAPEEGYCGCMSILIDLEYDVFIRLCRRHADFCASQLSIHCHDPDFNSSTFHMHTSSGKIMASTHDVRSTGASAIIDSQPGISHPVDEQTSGTDLSPEGKTQMTSQRAAAEVAQNDEEEAQDIEEGISSYRPGHFHPVYIGDVYHDKYQVLNKIGYGQYSTVWLVKDISTL